MKTAIQQEELPTDWSTVELGELLERITNGLTCVQEKEPPGIPVTRIETISNGVVDFERVRYVRDFDEAKKARFILQRGDILFSHINSDLHLGKTAVVTTDKPLLHGMNLLLLRTKKDQLDPYYLHYLLNYYRRTGAFMAIAQHAVNQSSLNQKKINSLKVPLAPLDQQKRIVAEIEKQFSRLDEAVANLKRVKANLKRYKAAILKAAVEGRLVETEAELARREGRSFETGAQLLQRILETRRSQWQGKGKYKEPAGPDTTDLRELPDGWVWASVNQIAVKVVDGTHHTPEYVTEGIPFISVKDVRDGTIHFDDTRFISPLEHDELTKRCNPEIDDVLITKSGTIGRTAVIETNRPFSLFVSVALIKPVKPVVISKHLQIGLDAYIQSIDIAQDVKGGLLKNLHLEDLRLVAVPIPPESEQHRIVAEVDRRLSLLRKTEAQLDANLRRAERLRQTILSRAFSALPVCSASGDLETV